MAQGLVPLTDEEIAERLEGLPGWAHVGDEITRTYAVRHHAGVAVIVHVADRERRIGHHADSDLRIDSIRLGLTTHDVGRQLTAADFDLAARVDAIVAAHEETPPRLIANCSALIGTRCPSALCGPRRGWAAGNGWGHRSRICHHHQRPAVHSPAQPGSGRVRRSNSMSICSTSRPRSARAPAGRRLRASSRSSRPSSISMPGLSPGPVRYRPGCLKAHSNRLRALAMAFGHMNSASTRRIAARVRADTPGIRCTSTCFWGRHRSARTALGRLRGIALSDQHHAGILPRPPPSGSRRGRPRLSAGISGLKATHRHAKSGGGQTKRRAGALRLRAGLW